MKKEFLKICVGLVLLVGQKSNAQTTKFISKNQALSVVEWYQHMLDSIHPDMYFYTPKMVVDSVFGEIRDKCLFASGDSISGRWLTRELWRCNILWDSHTQFGPTVLHFKTAKIFPPIRWTEDNEVFLLGENFQILSVNNVPVSTIDTYIREYIGKDMNIKRIYFNNFFTAYFQYCLDDHHIFPPYTVCGRDSTGKHIIKVIDGMSEREVNVRRWRETERYFGFKPNTSGNEFWGRKEPYQFEIYPKESIAIMRYESMFLSIPYLEIQSLLHHFFVDCQKRRIKYLFFDISRNSGGNIESFNMFGPYLVFRKNASYEVKYCNKDSVYWENRNIEKKVNSGIKPFQGQIFVYQSYYSFSAASEFAAIMKVTTNAVLVGTETGQGIPLIAGAQLYTVPCIDAKLYISHNMIAEERPKLNRTPEGFLLPDIPYPFLYQRRLDVNDCVKIINLSIKKD